MPVEAVALQDPPQAKGALTPRYRYLSDHWPATCLALRTHRRWRPLYAVAFAILILIEITVLGAGGGRFFGSIALSLYIVSWIVPAMAAISAAHEITLGRWSQVRISGARTADLWCARVVAPVLPWIAISAFLALPVFGIMPDPNRPRADIRIVDLSLYFTHLTPWSVLFGVVAYALASASFAVICAFRFRSVRSTVMAVYTGIGLTSYLGAMISLMEPVLGKWAAMPALTYIMFVEPWLIVAPPWMVGGTLYNVESEFIRTWIIPMTAGVFIVAAAILSLIAYAVMKRSRGSGAVDSKAG
jgi:hypothetical protein